MVMGWTWRTEFQNASTVCPVRVRPDLSVMVPETMTGSRMPRASKVCSTANNAALALRVSKMVSTRMTSTPPSRSASICSQYWWRSWSKVTARKPGSLTSGEIEAVTDMGPIEPATKPRWPVAAATSSTASRATRAAARFISRARSRRKGSWMTASKKAGSLRPSGCRKKKSCWPMDVAEKVLVSMMSAPASRYWRWMPRMTWGWVRSRSSLLPLRSLPDQSRKRSPR